MDPKIRPSPIALSTLDRKATAPWSMFNGPKKKTPATPVPHFNYSLQMNKQTILENAPQTIKALANSLLVWISLNVCIFFL